LKCELRLGARTDECDSENGFDHDKFRWAFRWNDGRELAGLR
jgi:hypothetical protein